MSFVPSASILNPSLAWSMGNGGEGRVEIKFPFEMDWYHEQPCTTFKSLQHRKEPKGFRHEFIVLQMTNGSICRIERMGDPDSRFDALSAEGSLAHDSAQMFPSHPDQAKAAELETSDIIAEITLPIEIDLKHVLYICRALHEGEKTRSYTLQVYNCYFLSLTLQCCLVRRSTRWDSSELFKGWLYHLGRSTSQLQLPSMLPSVQHWNDTSFSPILLRVFLSLSMSNPEDPDILKMIMKHVYDQLYVRFQLNPMFCQRLQDILDNELWYSNIAAIPHLFVEQEVEQSILSALDYSLNIGCSRLEDVTQAAQWRKWGEALIKLVSLSSICSKSRLTLSTHTGLPQVSPVSGINNNLTKAVKVLGYQRTKVQPELVQSLTIQQCGSICLNHLLRFCLWLLVTIFSLWGVHLFSRDPVPCTIIEVELDTLLGTGPVDFRTLESNIRDVHALCESKLAVWLNPPWADLHHIVEKLLVGNLQLAESEPRELNVCTRERKKRTCSIQEFQSHVLDRLEAQAELVEYVWLGSATEIKRELKDRLSEVWMLIREDIDPGAFEDSNGKRLRQCPLCNKPCDPKPSIWNRHMYRHLGIMRFKCAVCGEQLVTKDQVTMHYIRRHMGTTVTPASIAEARQFVIPISPEKQWQEGIKL
ncbi:hypothetical protein RSOL_481390 [Rhizoctonia solani AG-3 Rhs1AP]|uniref:C2H2-type domain-containing protein n=2 Tax=Rhizoctonia solani AG-3 TaxID=1086053 RepID=A0A074S0W2_9AGAM|nr:hypothetical protein RSOL_481390 [Rhizoctonia solani AG-3 Rhs1AP]KEP51195.1 hypothetical protein V565_065710 [Rhizoctonia solani 123E]